MTTTPNTAANGGQILTDEPLPCPFCGEPAKTFQYNGTTQATCSGKYVECAGVDVTAPVAMWNRRASRAAVPASEPAQQLDEMLIMNIAAAFPRMAKEGDLSEIIGFAHAVRTFAAPAPVSGMPDLAKLTRYRRVNYKMLIADDGEYIKFDDAAELLRQQGDK